MKKKPIKPTQPKIPVMPETHIRKTLTVGLYDGDDISAYGGPDVLSATIRVEYGFDSYDDHRYYLDIIYNEYIENPDYEKLLKKYEKDLDKFHRDVEKYEELMKLYKDADKKWKEYQKIQKKYNDILKMAADDPEKMKEFVEKFSDYSPE